jgi:hypothetical protein
VTEICDGHQQYGHKTRINDSWVVDGCTESTRVLSRRLTKKTFIYEIKKLA